MTRKAFGLAAALVLGVTFTVAVAQVRRAPTPVAVAQSPAQLAMRALIEGRYDEVATLTERRGHGRCVDGGYSGESPRRAR